MRHHPTGRNLFPSATQLKGDIMNPVDGTTSTSAELGGSRRRRLGRKARLAALSLALLSASTVGVAMTTESSAAAAGAINFCFRHTNGYPYNYDTFIQLYLRGQGWTTVQNVGRTATGCQSRVISGTWRNYPVRALAFVRVGRNVFIGTTPYYAPAGSLTHNLGTGIVRQTILPG
jgi:hypothetical protein